MTRQEVSDIAIAWAAAEGWNPGLHDAESFYATDPEGFWVGLLNGEPIASVSVVVYSPQFAFAGFYMVKPEYRGQGYGAQIGQAILNRLSGQTVGLDGVVAQQENYKKAGFRIAYRNIRFEGTVVHSPSEADPIGSDSERLIDTLQQQSSRPEPQSISIVPASQIDFSHLLAYDNQHFPAARPGFLRYWTTMPQSRTFVAKADNRIEGYATIRKCLHGYKIGPLFAEQPQTARQLLTACLNFAEAGSPFYLDIPEPNAEAFQLTQQYHMRMVFETARMYNGPAPELPLKKIYGITSFELG